MTCSPHGSLPRAALDYIAIKHPDTFYLFSYFLPILTCNILIYLNVFLDPVDQIGFNVLEEVPVPDPPSEEEDIDIEMSECLLPNLYTLNNEPPTDRWVLLQDLSNFLKIKSRDALLKQICPPSTSSVSVTSKAILRELKMTDFLEQARCCQFLNAGEKINTRASKIALIKYTDKVRELLNVESVSISAR